MRPATRILGVALLAGAAGALAGLLVNGPGPLLRTDWGQRFLQAVLGATADAPAGLAVAKRGQPLPPFSLPALDGTRVALPQTYAGRPVLVNVWASWCGPCIREMPELERFSSAQGNTGVQVVGIALDDPAAVQAFLGRVPVQYPILIDTPGPRDAGVRLGNPRGVLPYTALLDARGRLIKQKIGPFEPGEIDDWVE